MSILTPQTIAALAADPSVLAAAYANPTDETMDAFCAAVSGTPRIQSVHDNTEALYLELHATGGV